MCVGHKKVSLQQITLKKKLFVKNKNLAEFLT